MKSIIIQGSIKNHEQVQKCINSIRLWFDEIVILSCWENEKSLIENVFGFDIVVFSEDPGPGPFNGLYPVEQHCNLKRQIFGLKNALEKCDDDLILKIRNDCILTKDVFSFFSNQKSQGKMSFLEQKIVVGNIMTINPDTAQESKPFFRISDWFYMGFKKDILKICEIYEDIDREDYSHTFFGTEHILAFNLIKKFILPNLKIDELRNISSLAWEYIVNNFVIIDTITTAGIKNIGKWSNQPEYLPCYLTEKQYKEKLKGYQ